MTDVLDLKNMPEEVPPMAESIQDGGELVAISWEADHTPTPRRVMRERMLLAGIIVVGAAVAWWQASWLTFAVVALGVIAWELHTAFPAKHPVHINHAGVTINGHQHRHEHVTSYDIHAMPDGTARLSLQTKHWHLPPVHIPLTGINPDQVDAVLSRYVIRGEHRIPYTDYFVTK